jgi:hypothetical protein
VIVDVALVRMMQVTIVKVIRLTVVLDRRVPTVRPSRLIGAIADCCGVRDPVG